VVLWWRFFKYALVQVGEVAEVFEKLANKPGRAIANDVKKFAFHAIKFA
jgi:hypothetical protein